MTSMFSYCSSLTSLNLSNLDTSKVEKMSFMFFCCSSLTSLNLLSFNTSQVTTMESMFNNCTSLTSLDLSDFNTTSVTTMKNMFLHCLKLEYINLNNFNETKLTNVDFMFKNVPENVTLCTNDINSNSKILSKIRYGKKCYAIVCTDDLDSKINKHKSNDDECNQKCDLSLQYPYEYNGKCYAGCEKGFLYDENNNKLNKCKCELDECSKCPIEALNEGLCSECNTNYYPKENDPLNKDEYIKCYKDPNGYYLDNNIYKQCYYTCKTCYILGNNATHNCIKCNDNYPIGIKNNNSLNCYENCSYYYYVDNENNFHCTQDSSCPKEYSKLNKNKMECVKYDLLKELEDLKINVKNVTEKMSKVEEIKYYDNLIKTIEKEFIENYDIEKLNSGDEVIKTEKMTITFTTVENQKNNINKNVTAINLGGCEQLLRDYYNISSNEKLYMKTTEVYQEGMKIPKVEYDIYSALFGENLKKLNLKVCGNSKISISLPIKLTEKLGILNSSSGYYNNICYTTTSEDGTDISLKDRKTNFIDKNKTICQDDCEFSKYDSDNMKVECSCEIKESSSSITDMNIDKNK